MLILGFSANKVLVVENRFETSFTGLNRNLNFKLSLNLVTYGFFGGRI